MLERSRITVPTIFPELNQNFCLNKNKMHKNNMKDDDEEEQEDEEESNTKWMESK